MSRPLVLAVLLLGATRALAQSIDMTAGPNGVDVHITPPANPYPAQPLPPPPPAPAAEPAPAPGPGVMSDADLEDLLQAVNAEGFSEGKLAVIQTASRSAWFSVAQVGAIVDALPFSEDKLKALALTRSRIVDHQNDYKLLAHFDFDGDKQAAKKLLR